MVSFLDKLKRGMGAEATREEPSQEGNEVIEGTKPVGRKRKAKKLEIKTEKIDPEGTKEEKESISPEALADKKALANEKAAPDKEKWFEQEGQLAIDVYETKEDLVIQSTIAGINPQDLNISIEADRITIKGERTEESQEEGKNYFYQECYWGSFSREIILPVETDPSRAQATMKNGVLIIRLPKIEREKKRKIEVKS